MLPSALHIMARPADKQTLQKLNYLLIYALFYKISKMYQKTTLKKTALIKISMCTT